MGTLRQSNGREAPGRGYARTLGLLQALSEEPHGIAAVDLARRLGTPKSTLFLMLQHCREMGFVATEGGLVKIGPALLRLSSHIQDRLEIRRVARRHLEELANETRQDIYLGIRCGNHAVYVDRAEGVEAIRLNMAFGAPRPMHATAVGKVVLAFSDAALFETICRDPGLTALTERTIVEVDVLATEIERVRVNGYAVSDGEAIDGVRAFAVPILGRQGLLGGVAMAQPRQLGLKDPARAVALLRRAAARILAEMQPTTAAVGEQETSAATAGQRPAETPRRHAALR